MRRHGNRVGFTLVEVIVVIVIIAILAAIGVPALTGYIEKAHEKELIAVANTSAKALQAWATEQYSYGNVGNEGLTDQFGDPVSLVSYTGESRMPGPGGGADGGIVMAGYHPGSEDGGMVQAEPGEGVFLPAAVQEEEWYECTLTLRYHFIDKSGAERIETRTNNNISKWVDYGYELTYAEVACGMPKGDIAPPSLPEGYQAKKATQDLIDSGAALPSNTRWSDGYTWEGDISGDLYYEDVSSYWVKVVDNIASTGYGSEGYVITDVEFSDQNLLTHMKLTAPGGDFVVYADEAYHYNLDPTMGSST